MKAEITSDLVSGAQTMTYSTDTGQIRLDQIGWTFSSRMENRYTITARDPNSALVESLATETYAREGQLDVRIEARQTMSSDESQFHIKASIEAFEDEEPVFSKRWQESIDRDGV